jgi:hypothetical protein
MLRQPFLPGVTHKNFTVSFALPRNNSRSIASHDCSTSLFYDWLSAEPCSSNLQAKPRIDNDGAKRVANQLLANKERDRDEPEGESAFRESGMDFLIPGKWRIEHPQNRKQR